MFYWVCKYILIGPWLRLLFRPQVEGLENLPADGAAILAGNHLSFSDSIFLPLVCQRKITFLAKSDYFNTPGFKGWLTKLFMSGAGQVPVDRSGGRASEAALHTGLRVLGEGDLLGIYPEGTRSRRRPALPRQDRRGAHGARGRRAGHPVRDGQHPPDPAARARAAEDHAGQDRASARRWTSRATRACPATASCCAR